MTANPPSDRHGDRPNAASPVTGGAHAGHDALLIARLAGGDVSGTEEALARGLVASCGECAALLADLTAISAALPSSLPVGERRRDFQLTSEDAARLRGSRRTRWLDRARRQRVLLLQPLAGAAVALGLVMALVSAPGLLPLAVSPAGDAAAPEAAHNEMNAPTVAGAPADGASGAEKGWAQEPQMPEAAGASPAAGDGGSQATVDGEPGASPPRDLVGAGPAATGEPAGAGEPGIAAEPGVAGLETPPVLGAPEQEPGPLITGAGESADAETERGRPMEAWQIWLTVAVAGAIVLVGVTVVAARRRPAAG